MGEWYHDPKNDFSSLSVAPRALQGYPRVSILPAIF